MKTVFVILLSFVILSSCNNQTKPKSSENFAQSAVFTVDELQADGRNLVGTEVQVKGTVTHVCKEAGARCFIMGSNEDISLRIEAGTIGSFTQEQMGSEIQVSGILREVQLDEEDLAEMQKNAAEGESANLNHALGHDAPEMHDVDGGNHDSTNQAKKLKDIEKKLTESKVGYVPVYYLDGLRLIKSE